MGRHGHINATKDLLLAGDKNVVSPEFLIHVWSMPSFT
jgi:hypothetical protein